MATEKDTVFAFIIETHPQSDKNSDFDVCLTLEQMRIMMVAVAGFELTREELATIRPVYMALLHEWGRLYGRGR